MPKREQTRRFDASSVQGEGAYVEFRRFTWGEVKALQERLDKLSGDDAFVRETEHLVVERLAGWNWVDGNGAPLPLPKSTGDLDNLTIDEVRFLTDAIATMMRGSLGADEAAKN